MTEGKSPADHREDIDRLGAVAGAVASDLDPNKAASDSNIPEGASDLVHREPPPPPAERVIELLPCACGEPPGNLRLEVAGKGAKIGQVRGSCCGFWGIEFINNTDDPNKALLRAISAWNSAPRAS